MGYTGRPIFGEYNSRDSEIISRHIDWAEKSAIDFFAIEWADIQDWDNITLRDYYLKHLQSSSLKFCIFYDSSLALNGYRFQAGHNYDFEEPYLPGKTRGHKFLEDFEYLANTYFELPQYLKIGGRPLVIIYNASAFRNVKNYFEILKEKMDLFLVADVVCWSGIVLSKRNFNFLWGNPLRETFKTALRALRRLSPKNYESDFSLSRYFSAITGYNMYDANRTKDFLKNVDKTYRKFWRYAQSQNLGFVPNVLPGYDDRNLNGRHLPALDRKGGQFYEEFFEVAKKYLDPKLKMVLLTSFNEWHEGTAVEPAREYGNQYLELTKSLKGKLR